jgi:hypothetical protein
MTALSMTLSAQVHTGPCFSLPARLHGRRSAEGGTREYCLHDLTGRPLGTIAAPVARPVVGSTAPTVYLRRGN